MNPQTIIFIGRSGCGKGTQAKLMESYLKEHDGEKRLITYIETGAEFREFIKGGTYTSRLSKEIYERGDRQPNFLAVWNWSRLFVENLTGKEHVLIDGAPRSLLEAQVLDNAFEFYKRRANIVHIDVSRAWSEQNLASRGRFDDSAHKIGVRLDWFDTEVAPAIEYFRASPTHNYVRVNGEQSIEQVHADIVSQFKAF